VMRYTTTIEGVGLGCSYIHLAVDLARISINDLATKLLSNSDRD